MLDKALDGHFVRLRPICENDAAITFKWRNLDRAKFLNKGASSEEAQKKWIQDRPDVEYNFIIELKSTNEPVGMISLVSLNKSNRNAETARFLIGEEEKVKGTPVAVESMLLLYEFGFGKLELERLYGTIASSNKLMIKWQKYLGMKQEGVLRNHYYIGGEFQDAVSLGILKDEFENIAKPKMKNLIKWENK